jgi:hypothetical protein
MLECHRMAVLGKNGMGMRANTNRAAALDFGKLVDHYDAGRVAQTPEFVYQTTARLGTAASTRRLEVGAGTGQLTSPLTDPDLQRRLNVVYAQLSPDLVRDPEAHITELEPLLEDGRREIDDSGYMATVDYWTEERRVDISVDAYVEFQLSYAQIAALTTDQQAKLADGIREVAGCDEQATISLTLWQYTVGSRPTQR